MGTTAEVVALPKCDFCDKQAQFDAAIMTRAGKAGPWAYMCEEHFLSRSCRMLGTGWGQMLVTIND